MMKTLVALALMSGMAPIAVQDRDAGFACRLVLSVDTAFLDRWDHAAMPNLSVISSGQVVRGQIFGIYPCFSGCALDEHGNVHVTLDLRIVRPDGKTYFEEKGVDALEMSGGDGTSLLLPKDIRFVSFDPPDPLGSYAVHLEAHDLVGRRSVSADATVRLVEYKEGSGFENSAKLNEWFGAYLADPAPARLIPALRAFAVGGWSKELECGRGAFRDLFEANQWLFPILFAKFSKEDATTRELALWLLARSSYAVQPLVKLLNKEDLAVWDRVSAEHDPLKDPIEGRDDLNDLWGMYIPCRRLAPLVRLCMALAPEETGVVANRSIHDAKNGVDVPLGKVIVIVAPRILVRVIAWDPIARAYCVGLQSAEKLPEGVRSALQALLEGHAGSAK
jgi:hypothetical protein